MEAPALHWVLAATVASAGVVRVGGGVGTNVDLGVFVAEGVGLGIGVAVGVRASVGVNTAVGIEVGMDVGGGTGTAVDLDVGVPVVGTGVFVAMDNGVGLSEG